MIDILTHFKKHDISTEDIMYIYRNEKRTIIHCADGTENSSLIPIHELRNFLSESDFVDIAKGVLVNCSRIVNISDDGVYTMTDGKTFQGRKRCLSAHKRLRHEIHLDIPSVNAAFFPPMGLFEKCSVLDDMPLAYCVIELVFDENGHGVDFIFRYCNRQMAVVEGIPISEMINRSFYEVFKNGNKKWLVTYADVALNGSERIFTDFSPEIGKELKIYCYQPEPGFCSCILIPSDTSCYGSCTSADKKHSNP